MEWISVKEILPNDHNNNGDSYNCVLVYSSFNNCVAFAQYKKDHWILLSEGIYSDVGVIGIKLEDITYWMALPKKPESI